MSKILFGNESSTSSKKLGNQIEYATIKKGDQVYIMDDNSEIIIGEVVDLYYEGLQTDGTEEIVGCIIQTEFSGQVARYKQDGDIIWAVVPEDKGGSNADIKTVVATKKIDLPNIFAGRSESNISYSKFPEWDILPPDQFINPRIKK